MTPRLALSTAAAVLAVVWLAGCGHSTSGDLAGDERLAKADALSVLKTSGDSSGRVLRAVHVGRSTWRVQVATKGRNYCALIDVARFEARAGGVFAGVAIC
jgi:hypothetical protein